MKGKFYKDKFRRHLYHSLEKKKKVLKAIYKNENLPKELRYKAYFILKNFSKNSSITRIRNRCVITNRSRSIYKNFKLSRLTFRNLANQGYLVGIRKASW